MIMSDSGMLVLRMGVGLIFAVHGLQKVFGWWNGPGFQGWQAVMVRMGYRPATYFAAVSALAELLGGLALAIGFLTPVAAMFLVSQSIVIIGGAHRKRGFFSRDNGYEFPLSLFVGVLAVLLAGAGAWSVDAAIGIVPTSGLRLALLAVGVLGGFVTLAIPRLWARQSAVAA